MKKILCAVLLGLAVVPVSGQTSVSFNHLGTYIYPFTWPNYYSGYTPVFDRMGRDYVYMSSMELGLVTFDISNPANPSPVDTIPVSSFGGLKVSSLTQDGNYLYVAVGGFQGSQQRSGLAIVNVTNPLVPVIEDRWDSSAFNQGSAVVAFEGNYAYVGAMEEGVLIMDITNKQNIVFKSRILPNTAFGNPPYPPNARGMYVKNDTILLAFDAGGLRMIDATNKTSPQEIGMYINTSLTDSANAAYNNVVRIGNYAYVPVDYCGVEVIDVSNPSNMQAVAWYNPWDCNNLLPGHGWTDGDFHANEIVFDNNDSVVFISGGDQQVVALDARNPQQPVLLGSYGPPNDSIFTWGLDQRNGQVALSLLHNPWTLPVVSLTGGITLLSWSYMTGFSPIGENRELLRAVPNPSSGSTALQFSLPRAGEVTLRVYDVLGKNLLLQREVRNSGRQQLELDLSDLPSGIYHAVLETQGGAASVKLAVAR